MQQNHTDCTGLAQHALVLGSSGYVQSDSTESAQSVDSAIQPDPTQEPVKPEPTCLAPRATAIKEQGFSEAVSARIEASQTGSTRSTNFTKWCLRNQMDFRLPPLKAIADFLLYLFLDRKLQPGTVDGYRSAIADKLGNSPINVSKDKNLTRLPDSFHRQTQGQEGHPLLEPLTGSTPADKGSLSTLKRGLTKRPSRLVFSGF